MIRIVPASAIARPKPAITAESIPYLASRVTFSEILAGLRQASRQPARLLDQHWRWPNGSVMPQSGMQKIDEKDRQRREEVP